MGIIEALSIMIINGISASVNALMTIFSTRAFSYSINIDGIIISTCTVIRNDSAIIRTNGFPCNNCDTERFDQEILPITSSVNASSVLPHVARHLKKVSRKRISIQSEFS